jgi:hypothetical protein
MADDFFASNINNVYWVLTLNVVGREGRQMFVQMRGARAPTGRRCGSSGRSMSPCGRPARLVAMSGQLVSRGSATSRVLPALCKGHGTE